MKDEIEICQQILEANSPITGNELKSPFARRGSSAKAGSASEEERAKERRLAQNPGLRGQESQALIPDHIKDLVAKMRSHSNKTGEIGHIDRSNDDDTSHPSNLIKRTDDDELDIKAIKDAAAKRREAGEPNPLLSTPEVKPVVKKKAGKKKAGKKKVVKRPRVKKA